ncbi:hypothetical protein EJB05_02884, partial [Eragrostis curvula]
DDLWDTSVWDVIKRAIPEGNCCSRVIPTTQIEDVALACCEDQSGQLFLCSSSGRLKKDINQVFNDLSPQLKTCLLYLNMYTEDYVIRKVDLVRQWLNEGYLGVEGTSSRQTQQGNTVEVGGLEEVAGRYFDELVYKKIIQPANFDNNGKVLSCTVNHNVMDFITQKSMEEDFITVVDYPETIADLPDRVRRLSIKFGGAKSAQVPRNMKVSQVRSLMFSGFFKCLPSLEDYWVLRVLILDIWSDQDEEILDLGIIGEMFQLRYLKIECNMTIRLPAVIRQLKYLQTLDVAAKVAAFPQDICCLKELRHLHIQSDSCSRNNIMSDSHFLPVSHFSAEGLIHQIANNITSNIAHLIHLSLYGEAALVGQIADMTSLQSLGKLNLSTCSSYNVSELGYLTNMQDLHLTTSAVSSSRLVGNIKCLASILAKFSNLRSLIIDGEDSSNGKIISDILIHVPSPPVNLERFELSPNVFIMPRLPEWIGYLRKLRTLNIAIRESGDVGILKQCTSLAAISLHVWTTPTQRIIFNEGFQALKYFKFTCPTLCVQFMAGAMPRVQTLKLSFNVDKMQQYWPENIGTRNLVCLKVISVKIGGASTDQASTEAAKRRLMEAFGRDHPRLRCAKENHQHPPVINIKMVDWIINGDKKQISADVITSGSPDEQHKMEETDIMDIDRIADCRLETVPSKRQNKFERVVDLLLSES